MTPIVFSQLFAIALALAPAADARAPQLVVSPAVIEWQLPARGRSQVRVRMANAGSGTMRLRAALGGWSLDQAGVATPQPADPDGLSGRLQVHPRQLELAPGQQRSLRLWLASPEGLEAGEHRALLRLQVERDDVAGSDRFDLAVYAWQGPVQARPRLDGSAWHACGRHLHWSTRAGNDGSRHARLDGWLVVTDADGAVHRHALPRTPVLPAASLPLVLVVPWSGRPPQRVQLEGRFGPLELTGRAVAEGDGRCDE